MLVPRSVQSVQSEVEAEYPNTAPPGIEIGKTGIYGG